MSADPYDHRQRALWLAALLLLAVVGIAVPLTLVGLWEGGSRASVFVHVALVFCCLLCLAAALLFSSLRVQVSVERVRVAFGPGWPRREFPCAEITQAEAVRNRWWYGWGIRLTPHGWLWNVSGLDAVSLTLADGRRFRIGTDEPEALLGALRAVGVATAGPGTPS